MIEQSLIVGDHDHRALGVAKCVHAPGDDTERIDVETGVGLVEHRQPRLHDRHLQNLVALLLAATESGVDRSIQEVRLHLDQSHGLFGHFEEVTSPDLVVATGAADRIQGRAQEVHVVDAGDLDRILETHEDTGSCAVLRFHLEQIGAIEGDGATDLVAVTASERVCERALARPVRTHDRVYLAGTDVEVETLEDRDVPDRDGQTVHVQHQPTLPSKLALSRR